MYELCCDMIDLLISMSEIYGQPNVNDVRTIEGDDVLNSESTEWNSEHEIDENNESVTNGEHLYSNSKN